MRLLKCDRCGKFFIPGSGGHLYKLYNREKNKQYNYCSYTCWRKDGGDNGKKYLTRY